MSHHFQPRRHPHRPARRAPDHVVETLRALVRARLATDMTALVSMAGEIDRTGDAGRFLTGMGSDADLVHALRLLECHLESQSVGRYHNALSLAGSGKVGIVPPVPRHLIDDFGWSSETVILSVDHHELPPSVRHARRFGQIVSFPEAQTAVEQLDVLLFDAHRASEGFEVRRGVLALLDERHLPNEITLLIHERRHADLDDRPVGPAIASRFQLI